MPFQAYASSSLNLGLRGFAVSGSRISNCTVTAMMMMMTMIAMMMMVVVVVAGSDDFGDDGDDYYGD